MAVDYGTGRSDGAPGLRTDRCPELENAIIDSTVEQIETIAARGVGRSKLGLEPGAGS